MKPNPMKVMALALLTASMAANADQDVLTKSFSVKPGGKLVMNVDRGSIHVTTSDSDKVDVKITRELKRASGAEAKRVFEQHKIEFVNANNEVKIEATSPKQFGFNNPFNQLQEI